MPRWLDPTGRKDQDGEEIGYRRSISAEIFETSSLTALGRSDSEDLWTLRCGSGRAADFFKAEGLGDRPGNWTHHRFRELVSSASPSLRFPNSFRSPRHRLGRGAGLVGVEVGHPLAVAVEELRVDLPLCVLVDQKFLLRLAPAGVRHVRVHVGEEPVLA